MFHDNQGAYDQEANFNDGDEVSLPESTDSSLAPTPEPEEEDSPRLPRPVGQGNTLVNRPRFDTETKGQEKRLLKLIHSVLAANSPRDIETFTDLVNEAAKNMNAPGNIYERASDLTTYLSKRAFIFEKKVTDNFYRNTSFAQRKGMVQIVDFIQKNSFALSGCCLKDIKYFIKKTPEDDDNEQKFIVYDPAKWESQPWKDKYFFFFAKDPTYEMIRKIFEDYPEYFILTEANDTTYIKLQPLVFELPEFWDEDLLPEHPTSAYYDRSREFGYLTYIRSTTENFAKGGISGGQFEGRKIHLLHSKMGLHDVDMSKYAPVRSYAFAIAHMTLNHKNDLNGIRLLPCMMLPAQRLRHKEAMRADIDLRILDDEETPAVPLPRPETVSADVLAQRGALRAMISTEEAQITLIDKILSKGPMSDNEIRDKVGLEEKQIFPISYDAIEFILDRPYLYALDNEKAGCRAAKERMTYRAFFELLSDIGQQGMTEEKIAQVCKSGGAGDVLQQMALEGRLEELMHIVKPFVGKIYITNPILKKHFTLKVHFDKQSKTLLPHYANHGPHLSTRF